MTSQTEKTAVLYRMVMPEHICPYGLKARALLRRQGYAVEDRWLKTRGETDAFKAANDVQTTPQTFIDGKRIGTYDDLRRFFHKKKVPDPSTPSYRPVAVVFAVALAVSLAARAGLGDDLFTFRSVEWFIAFSMCILALLKLQDVEAFSTMFLNYDLLARRWVPYAYIYPFAEFVAGVLMIAGKLLWLAVPLAMFVGVVGSFSVIKAVYVDKRELKCACVGGASNVPLGFISLTENLMMVAMAIWMGWFRFA